jgi:Ring hydroxylating alpha subunit (catalytic domain)
VLLIPRQDLSNIPRMQKGLHSRAMRQTWLASNQEKIILNMHQELDRYLR